MPGLHGFEKFELSLYRLFTNQRVQYGVWAYQKLYN